MGCCVRILLTGGTGFVGRGWPPRSRRGATTWSSCHAIPPAPPARRWLGRPSSASGARRRSGSPRRRASGRRPVDAGAPRGIRSSRVDTTTRLARAIASASSRPRVFSARRPSASTVMRRDDVVCDEQTPPGRRARPRLRSHGRPRRSPRERGVRVVHPRIGVVLGRGGALAKMEGAFRWFVGGPSATAPWIAGSMSTTRCARSSFSSTPRRSPGAVNLVAPAPRTMTTWREPSDAPSGAHRRCASPPSPCGSPSARSRRATAPPASVSRSKARGGGLRILLPAVSTRRWLDCGNLGAE